MFLKIKPIFLLLFCITVSWTSGLPIFLFGLLLLLLFLSFQLFASSFFPSLFSPRHPLCPAGYELRSRSPIGFVPLLRSLFNISSSLVFREPSASLCVSLTLSSSPSSPVAPAGSSISCRGLWCVWVCVLLT